MLGYNLFSQYIRCFCGFNRLSICLVQDHCKLVWTGFLQFFYGPGPQFFGSGNFWDWSDLRSVWKNAQDQDQTEPLSTKDV